MLGINSRRINELRRNSLGALLLHEDLDDVALHQAFLSIDHAFQPLPPPYPRHSLRMDPLSVTASIIAILKLSSEVFGYLNDVKNAPKDLEQYTVEASNLFGLLVKLRYRLEEGGSNDPWYNAVRNLEVENGPLDQFKQVLEQLQIRMTGRGRLKNTGDRLMWKFSKEEIKSMLARMERLKTLVHIALEMDHLLVSIMALYNETTDISKQAKSSDQKVHRYYSQQH